MTKVLILNTGGTISMSEDGESGRILLNARNPIEQHLSAISLAEEWVVENLFNLPSPHIQEENMLQIQQRIVRAAEEGYTGIVVTHGTDTLEETAYFLELTTNLKIPIVITGAMRSSNELGSDGLPNLRSALIVATATESRGKGVLVVMNDEVHTATYVTKTHTTNVATFQTPTFGPIGLVSKNEVLYFQQLLHHEYYPITSVVDEVYLLKAYAGMDGTLIDAVAHKRANGLVIEALGAGNLPLKSLPALSRCLALKIPVVLVSRAFNGVTYDLYDYPGGGKQLKEDGVIFTTGLSGQKARIKLLVLLSAGKSLAEIAKAFEG